MWPSKHLLGVQLAYGIQGNGVVAAEEVSSSLEELPSFQPKLHFPRLRDRGPVLRPIKNSSWNLPTPTDEKDDSAATSMSWWRSKSHSTIYAPDELTEALVAELAPLNELFAHDPTEGDHMVLVNLGTGVFANPVDLGGHKVVPSTKNSVVNIKAVVYVCGDNNTQLRIAPILPQNKKVTAEDSGDTSNLYLPAPLQGRTNYASCKFPHRILQIQVSPLLPIIAIRSSSKVHFVRFSWQNDPHTKAPVFDVLPCSIKLHEFTDHDLAHIEFSPTDKHSFSIIDARGNLSIWRLDTKTWTIKLSHQKIPSAKPGNEIPLAISDLEDTSSWKSICWAPKSESLIAFSRNEATIFRLNRKSSIPVQKLITSNLWANIWDIKSHLGYAFLLTSREIIFLKLGVEVPFKRLVSWKHYLDNEDSSLKLHVCEAEEKDLFICSVFSKNTPLAMIYTFGFHNGKPALLNDPSCIQTDDTCSYIMFDRIVYDGRDKLTYCEFQATASGIQFSSLHGVKSLSIAEASQSCPSESPDDETVSKDIFNMISIAEATNAFHSFSTSNRMTNENEEIWEDEKSDNVPLVQNYAFRLGHDIKKRLRIEEDSPERTDGTEVSNGSGKSSDDYLSKYTPISAIADCLPITIDDMEEFDSMIEQLNDFYESCGVKLQKDMKRMLKGMALANCGSVQQLQKSLEETYPEHPNLSQAAMILANSFYKVSNDDIESRLQDVYREELKGCSSELTSMFDDWDIQIPKVRAKSAPPTVDTKKRGLLHRALTQNSQHMSQLTSQASQLTQESAASQATQLSQSPQPGSSQEIPEIMLSQPSSSQARPATSRLSQKLKRPGSQGASQKKKKRKGGFA